MVMRGIGPWWLPWDPLEQFEGEHDPHQTDPQARQEEEDEGGYVPCLIVDHGLSDQHGQEEPTNEQVQHLQVKRIDRIQ